MVEGEQPRVKRIRLTGERFQDGRLPVDSLIELERYQNVIRTLAEFEWRHDHPREHLPADFRSSVSLTIERIDVGSADILLVFEQQATYADYQIQAQDAVDATITAAYAGEALPTLAALSQPAEAELREELAEIGGSLRDGQSIELYAGPPDSMPVVITIETRKQAVAELILSDFLMAPQEALASPESTERSEGSLVGRVTAVDADSTKYEIITAQGKVHGWYRENSELLEDLRAVLNSAEEGPLTRITGELRVKADGSPRLWQTSRIERVEFDDTEWGARLTEFAQLPSGWLGGEGAQISFIALDGTQQLLRATATMDVPRPGVFPTPEGGVLVEWTQQSGIYSVEVLEDGAFELFSIKRDQAEGTHSETRDVTEAIRFAAEQS